MKKNITKTKSYKDDVEANLFFMRISSEIFKARKEKGMSQKELAAAVGTTQRILSVIENAELDYNMGLNLLYRILKYFKKEMVIGNKDMVTGVSCYTMSIAETIKSTHSFSDDIKDDYVYNGKQYNSNQEVEVMYEPIIN